MRVRVSESERGIERAIVCYCSKCICLCDPLSDTCQVAVYKNLSKKRELSTHVYSLRKRRDAQFVDLDLGSELSALGQS